MTDLDTGLDPETIAWFRSLDADEQSEFLELLAEAVGQQWELSPKQTYAEALWHKCDWMLYGGAAGGGKTELMIKHGNDLSQQVPAHSTLVLRQSIPELRRSIILRLKARIVQFKLPGKLRKVDGVTQFTYANDSLIECGYCATDDHVANYLSAEYDCVASDTPIVMADGSHRAISSLRVGELVATLEGPRPIRAVACVGVKEAVQIWTPSGSVICSMSHRYLANDCEWHAPWEVMATSVSSTSGPSDCATSDGTLQVVRQLPTWSALAMLYEPHPQSAAADATNDRCHESLRARPVSSTPDSWASCSHDSRPDDERSHRPSADDRAHTPPPDDAATPDVCPSPTDRDSPARTPTRSPVGSRTYCHPYTKEARPLSAVARQAFVQMAPAGEREMWDMTVGEANHYVSSSNMIHQNCMMIDEASLMTAEQIILLSSRLRTTRRKAKLGARPHLGLFSNPGGPAHAWLHEVFVSATDHGKMLCVLDITDGIEHPHIVRTYPIPCQVDGATDEQLAKLTRWADDLTVEVDPQRELVVGFVPAKASDNPHIDPGYMKYLNALPERRRRQLRDGDWDTFEGQYFHEWNRDVHIVPWFEIPEGWKHARGLDFGSTAPWACLMGAWDNDGNVYLYDECYGAGFTPQEQAAQAKEHQTRTLSNGKTVKVEYFATLADPSVFADKRGTGKSIADLWRVAGLQVNRAKNARVAGWANVRQYLWDSERGKPRLYVLEGACPNLVRTLPLMQHDKKHNEDLDTRLEDHAADALRYLLSARPIGVRVPEPKVGLTLEGKFNKMLRTLDKRPRSRLFG